MVKNRYNSLINKWVRKNGKKCNSFIEKKILESLSRSYKRNNKKLMEE